MKAEIVDGYLKEHLGFFRVAESTRIDGFTEFTSRLRREPTNPYSVADGFLEVQWPILKFSKTQVPIFWAMITVGLLIPDSKKIPQGVSNPKLLIQEKADIPIIKAGVCLSSVVAMQFAYEQTKDVGVRTGLTNDMRRHLRVAAGFIDQAEDASANLRILADRCYGELKRWFD